MGGLGVGVGVGPGVVGGVGVGTVMHHHHLASSSRTSHPMMAQPDPRSPLSRVRVDLILTYIGSIKLLNISLINLRAEFPKIARTKVNNIYTSCRFVQKCTRYDNILVCFKRSYFLREYY